MAGHIGATLSAWREMADALEVPHQETVAEQKQVVLERVAMLMAVLSRVNPMPYELYYSPVLNDYLCWLEGWCREDGEREIQTPVSNIDAILAICDPANGYHNVEVEAVRGQ